jgi:hypothetical protein
LFVAIVWSLEGERVAEASSVALPKIVLQVAVHHRALKMKSVFLQPHLLHHLPVLPEVVVDHRVLKMKSVFLRPDPLRIRTVVLQVAVHHRVLKMKNVSLKSHLLRL